MARQRPQQAKASRARQPAGPQANPGSPPARRLAPSAGSVGRAAIRCCCCCCDDVAAAAACTEEPQQPSSLCAAAAAAAALTRTPPQRRLVRGSGRAAAAAQQKHPPTPRLPGDPPRDARVPQRARLAERAARVDAAARPRRQRAAPQDAREAGTTRLRRARRSLRVRVLPRVRLLPRPPALAGRRALRPHPRPAGRSLRTRRQARGRPRRLLPHEDYLDTLRQTGPRTQRALPSSSAFGRAQRRRRRRCRRRFLFFTLRCLGRFHCRGRLRRRRCDLDGSRSLAPLRSLGRGRIPESGRLCLHDLQTGEVLGRLHVQQILDQLPLHADLDLGPLVAARPLEPLAAPVLLSFDVEPRRLLVFHHACHALLPLQEQGNLVLCLLLLLLQRQLLLRCRRGSGVERLHVEVALVELDPALLVQSGVLAQETSWVVHVGNRLTVDLDWALEVRRHLHGRHRRRLHGAVARLRALLPVVARRRRRRLRVGERPLRLGGLPHC
eukprot:Rhum_TRINITY_DN14996_c0_g1::Rhum_TRINITY_DN14996_c0_g1_i1::g.132235::m.132235